MRTTRENKNKKTLVAILLLLIAIVLIIGAAVSYFSDYLSAGDVTAEAGTLDLNANGSVTLTRCYQTLVGDVATEKTETVTSPVANLNPGDIIKVEIPIKNDGTKSAWLRNTVTFTAGQNSAGTALTTAQIQAGFDIYPGAATIANIRATSTAGSAAGTIAALDKATTVTTPNNGFKAAQAADYDIIDGSLEEDDGTSGVQTTKTYTFFLYFRPEVGNEYQKVQNINLLVETQAIQYRNNTGANWTGVVTSAFSL